MICVEFVPHILTNEQNEHKVPTCETSSEPLRLVHSFLFVSFLEMSLLCFSTTLIEKSAHGVENESSTAAQKVLLLKVEV